MTTPTEQRKAERKRTEDALRNAGFRLRIGLYDPAWVRGPGPGNMGVQLTNDRFAMWGPTSELPTLLAGPALTPAEVDAIEKAARAMELMTERTEKEANQEFTAGLAQTLRNLLARMGAVPSPSTPMTGEEAAKS